MLIRGKRRGVLLPEGKQETGMDRIVQKFLGAPRPDAGRQTVSEGVQDCVQGAQHLLLRNSHARIPILTLDVLLPATLQSGVKRWKGLVAARQDSSYLHNKLQAVPALNEKYVYLQREGLPGARSVFAEGTEDTGMLWRFLLAHELVNLAGGIKDLADLAVMAIQRGRFMELAAPCLHLPVHGEYLYMAGLLSVADAICAVAFESALATLAAPDEVLAILLDGACGSELLWLALYIEQGNWQEVRELLEAFSSCEDNTAMLYGQATVWTHFLLGE